MVMRKADWLIIILFLALGIFGFIGYTNINNSIGQIHNEVTGIYDNTQFSQNLEKISKSVVEVVSYPVSQDRSPNVALYVDKNGQLANAGTGFSVKDGGYFLTAYHIVKDAQKIKVLDNDIEYDAKLIAKNESLDLAIIHVDGLNLPILKITEQQIQKEGMKVAFIGYPLGYPVKVTHEGIISSVVFYNNMPIYAINSFVNHGNSGGPVFLSDSNEIIGIISMRESLFQPPAPVTLISEEQFSKFSDEEKMLYRDSIFLYANTAKAIYDNSQAGIGIAVRLNKEEVDNLLSYSNI